MCLINWEFRVDLSIKKYFANYLVFNIDSVFRVNGDKVSAYLGKCFLQVQEL